jgi:iron complex outermembrane receptor protein
MKVINEAGPRPRVCGLSLAIADLVRSSRAAAAGGALLASALAIVPVSSVVAQDQEDASVLEEVVVTGSRIVRQDFTANSPVQTVDEALFEQTSAVGVETVLNRLPQFVPAVTQFTTGDVQQTVTNTVGASTVSLRGLGPNRNLVLINGRRAMPIDPRMVVDTNTIPAAAIQRVEVISGGASAVYGADAVGGVVNFILKDNYEGANVDVRFGDTQHGGDQTVTISGLFGANVADGRGNVMFGLERDTRSKQYRWERDWRVEDMANPNTNGGGFAFGSATWFHNEPGTPANNPTQAAINTIFPTTGCTHPNPTTGCTISNNLTNTRLRLNRDGSVFTGLADAAALAPGAYLFNGPVYNDNTNGRQGTGDLDGAFQGLPGFVMQPDGRIKENVFYEWASTPLERLSSFANGHFDVSDNVRVTGSAMVTRTQTESSLGLTAANINQWGAGIPFGTGMYRGSGAAGSNNTYYEIPDSWTDTNLNGIPDAGDRTHPDYLPGGRFGLNCEAPYTAATPYADGMPGCTNSEAWPVPAQIYNVLQTRGGAAGTLTPGPGGNNLIWASREPDWMRNALGAGRSTTNTSTTMSFTLGLEGDLPSGDHQWDMSLYTGRSDNTVNQLGSMRLTTYRDLLASPNYGKGAIFDPNPWEFAGFAESVPTCTSGLPIADDRAVSQDCLQMVSPALKNLREMTQTIFEANLVGDLAEMRNGPLQYALGFTYRENGFDFTPDNLSDIQNLADPIAGLFPNEASAGEFDVSEIYGELLVPIISDGRTGVEHFNLELGGRVSDWSMPDMPNLNTYKALMDWGITQRYRIRGGFNRAFRAPNLGELFSRRTQLFGAGGATNDWCSQDLNAAGGFSATPAGGAGTAETPQSLQSQALCRQLMGAGALQYYDGRPRTDQPSLPNGTPGAGFEAGGLGVPITFGDESLREEQADTWTIGVAMDLLEDWRLTVDWWRIEIENMIATEGLDSVYQRCLDMAFNPTGDITASSCPQITRNPTTGNPGVVNRSFTNEGLSHFEGVDLQLNWNRQLSGGGNITLNSSATVNLHEITQDRADLAAIDRKGYGPAAGPGSYCALGLQCLNYDYRLFTTVGYGRGSWDFAVLHQYWPELDHNSCIATPNSASCLYDSPPGYQLFTLSGNYRFNRYRLSAGIENLMDEEPPCLGANPGNAVFPLECSRTTDGATYDPLGRRFYVSMTMDF